MITPDKLDRINALSRKSKTPEGLTTEEMIEQADLRREYIDAVKASLSPQLERIRYLEPDGSITNPQTGKTEGMIPQDSRDPRHQADDDEDDDEGSPFSFPPLR